MSFTKEQAQREKKFAHQRVREEYQDQPHITHVQTNINNMIATYGEEEAIDMINQVLNFKQFKKVM